MFSKKQLIIGILITVIIFCAGITVLVFYYRLHPKISIKEVEVKIPVIVNLEEGGAGDFTLEAEKKEGGVILKWPEEVKVIQIKVYNLGDPRNLEDHKLVFFTAILKMDKSQVESSLPQFLARFKPGEAPFSKEKINIPEPAVFPFLPSPYQIGVVPDGFFDNTPDRPDSIFRKDQFYLIEVRGVEGQELKSAEYLLLYK